MQPIDKNVTTDAPRIRHLLRRITNRPPWLITLIAGEGAKLRDGEARGTRSRVAALSTFNRDCCNRNALNNKLYSVSSSSHVAVQGVQRPFDDSNETIEADATY